MGIKAVLFDLDGTLLPMDQDIFIKAYFGGLVKMLVPHGYDPERTAAAIWSGTKAMIGNDGSRTNEAAFWDTFCGIIGQHTRQDESLFQQFYEIDFQKVQQICGFAPEAASIIRWLKEQGVRVILATNPLFPSIATESRARWAGLDPRDFELITTYENSSFCKPNPDYYRDILQRCSLQPQECVMVGNDVSDDMVTVNLGMQVFLLTDCLINAQGAPISTYPQGGFPQLKAYLETVI